MNSKLFGSLALLTLASSAAVANQMCVNDATLQSYIIGNSTFTNACQIGDKLFWNFQLASGPGSLGLEPTASGIQVQPVPGDGLTNIGISFKSGFWAVSQAAPLDQFITYNVATVSGDALIKDATLTITGGLAGPGGSGSVTETLSPPVPGNPLSASLPSPLTMNIDFSNNKVSTFAVTNRMTMLGGLGFADRTQISMFENDFSEVVVPVVVPEPLVAGQIGAGLLVLGLAALIGNFSRVALRLPTARFAWAERMAGR